MKYDHKKVEKRWQDYWEKKKLNQVDLDKAEKPFYNLMMFPYPSAEGLHVGNMYAFVHSDAYGRFMKLKGFDVFEPIGLDGFGIHSENYAIKIGEHIKEVSKRTEKHFYEQLHLIGNQYDWSRKLETYKPEYYKWTQWLFLQMYKAGLAYRAKALVNWCPSCKTVLSDEQVVGGECERCGSQTEKRPMEQWFFKITDFAERLLENLDAIDWPEEIKTIQRNWIGKSEGATIKFSIFNFQFSKKEDYDIEVFTTRPDTIFGATFMVICPEHEIIKDLESRIQNLEEVKKYIKQAQQKSALERTDLNKNKTGVRLRGIEVINPANQKTIPIFVADYVLAGYGSGAIMAVPGHDERDFEFAKKYGLEIKNVIDVQDDSVFTGEGILINSGDYNGLTSKEATEKIIEWLEENNIGSRAVKYKLRDWCVSRQRYWGPPIPMVYCDKCGIQPVLEKDLPVLLPEMKDFLPDGSGKGPLAKNKDFVKTKCPQCGGEARRETDVSDPFVDSCWYYLRYPCVEFKDQPFDKERLKKWLPVNMYIGGKEHAVLHLLYSRFVAMVLKDAGFIKEEEPFKKFFAHGLLIRDGAKMSKSKGNVVNPDEYIKKFGADSVRMYLMFLGDARQGGDWRDTGINGMYRFVNRIWKLYQKVELIDCGGGCKDVPDGLPQMLHKTIKKITEDIETLHFNTAISQMMIFTNFVMRFNKMPRGAAEKFLTLLAPFAPHIAEELWARLGNKSSIFKEKWPEYDENLIKEDTIQIPVQINGRLRAVLTAPADIPEDEAKKLALNDGNVLKWLEGKEPKKVIFAKRRLVNIVI